MAASPRPASDVTPEERTAESIVRFYELVRERAQRDLRLPNLLGIGAPRCGTTTLYGLLRSSPDVHATPVKEVNYFGVLERKSHGRGLSLEDYRLLFAGQKDEKYICEVSPVYLSRPASIYSIRQTLGDVKVIISLRDPIERALSQFSHHKLHHKYTNPTAYFRDAIARFSKTDFEDSRWFAPSKALAGSLYSEQIERCLTTFGPENVLILLYETLREAPGLWIADIEKFTGLSLGRKLEKRYLNASREKRPELDPETHGALKAFFADDARKCQDLLQTDLSGIWETLQEA